MADLNALIAQGAQFQAPIDPFAQYAKMQQLNTGMNQNALAQYQLEAAKRSDVQANALNAAYASATDPETGAIDYKKVTKSLASGGAGSQIPAVLKNQFESQRAQTEAQKAQTDLVDAKLKQSRQFLDTINPSSPEAVNQYIAWHKANHADPVLGPVLAARGATQDNTMAAIQAAVAQGPQAFADLVNKSKLGVEKFMEMNKPVFTSQDLGGTNRVLATPGLGGVATVVPGSVGTKTITPGEESTAATARRGQDITAETTRRGQNMTDAREQARILISEEDQRRAADPAFQQRMAGAKQLGQDMAKNQVLRETQLPKVLDTAAQTVSQIDALIGKRDKTGKLLEGQRPHPGFANAVGAGLPLRFVPGTSESDFQTRFDQIKGGAFLQAFETLKGGGSITNVEGEKGTSALNRMNLAQSEKEFVQAARDFQDVIRTGVELAKKMAGEPTAAPTGGAPAAAAPTVSNW